MSWVLEFPVDCTEGDGQRVNPGLMGKGKKPPLSHATAVGVTCQA